MSELTCIIVDDERLARVELRQLLQKHPAIQILEEASNALEAIPLIEKFEPDLLFLDIQMPQWSGFDLLEKLDWVPLVIFTTAYDHYALKAFEVNALDYLLKPINPERLNHSLQKISELLSLKKETPTVLSPSSDRQIFIKDGDHCHFIRISEIHYLKAYDNYVRIYFNNSSAMVKKSMSTLEERLDNTMFFRCNRAEMINLQQIDYVDAMAKGKLKISLRNGRVVEVSERKSAIFRERMGI